MVGMSPLILPPSEVVIKTGWGRRRRPCAKVKAKSEAGPWGTFVVSLMWDMCVCVWAAVGLLFFFTVLQEENVQKKHWIDFRQKSWHAPTNEVTKTGNKTDVKRTKKEKNAKAACATASVPKERSRSCSQRTTEGNVHSGTKNAAAFWLQYPSVNPKCRCRNLALWCYTYFWKTFYHKWK